MGTLIENLSDRKMFRKKVPLSPALMTVVSFLGLIFFGTVLLSLPAATNGVKAADLLTAFFTAVSSVCVTGLAVEDTGTFFSVFGQVVILLLIQLGGLGIMTLAAAIPVIFGRQLKRSRREEVAGMVDKKDYADIQQVLKSILLFTFVIEFVGGLVLTLRFFFLWGDFGKAVYYGLFHSISAFCNAGFALFSDNLVSFHADPVINLTLMLLIIFGGIGFVVLTQVVYDRSFGKMTLHTKLTLVMTGLLIVVPSLYFFFHEFSHSLINYPIPEKIWISVFQTVSARTAGFNTIDLNLFTDASIFLLCILMFIGAASGGTAGGVKVTTIAILLLSVRAILFGREHIEVFGRRIAVELVTKTIALLALSFMGVTLFVILLLMTEQAEFIKVLFEALSAFGTVGLSLGLTPELSVPGKLMISALMFLGRVGPLTLIFMMSTKHKKVFYRFPEESVMVG